MTAVFEFIFDAIPLASRFPVLASMSLKTILDPCKIAVEAVATNVIGEVITSRPFQSSVEYAQWSAAVPEETAIAPRVLV